jgi:hypothetical protein
MNKLLIFSTLCCFLGWPLWMSAQVRGTWQGHLGSTVAQWNNLPGNANAPGTFLALGGSGFGTVGRRLLLGGSGFSTVARTTNDTRQVRADFGMGFADLGYVWYRKGRAQHHAFVGVGGGGGTLRYDNRGETSWTLADNLQVASNQRATVSAGGWGWQAGISLNRLLFDPASTSGGLKLGLDVGVYQLPRLSQWQYAGDDRPLQGARRGRLQGAFVRLTVGGAW